MNPTSFPVSISSFPPVLSPFVDDPTVLMECGKPDEALQAFFAMPPSHQSSLIFSRLFNALIKNIEADSSCLDHFSRLKALIEGAHLPYGEIIFKIYLEKLVNALCSAPKEYKAHVTACIHTLLAKAPHEARDAKLFNAASDLVERAQRALNEDYKAEAEQWEISRQALINQGKTLPPVEDRFYYVYATTNWKLPEIWLMAIELYKLASTDSWRCALLTQAFTNLFVFPELTFPSPLPGMTLEQQNAVKTPIAKKCEDFKASCTLGLKTDILDEVIRFHLAKQEEATIVCLLRHLRWEKGLCEMADKFYREDKAELFADAFSAIPKHLRMVKDVEKVNELIDRAIKLHLRRNDIGKAIRTLRELFVDDTLTKALFNLAAEFYNAGKGSAFVEILLEIPHLKSLFADQNKVNAYLSEALKAAGALRAKQIGMLLPQDPTQPTPASKTP